MAKAASPFIGRWRIVEMPDFDDEYLDEEEPAYIEFGPHEQGEFHFGYVHGNMNYRLTERDGKPAVEWSWDGNDEHHPAMGRGWAVLEDDGKLRGRIFYHGSDDFEFTAEGRKPLKALPKASTKFRVVRHGRR